MGESWEKLPTCAGNIEPRHLGHNKGSTLYIFWISREQKALKLPALSMNIVEMARQHGRVSVSFLAVSLGDNRNTVKKHLQSLVNRGLLERRGKGRGTYYIIAAIP